MPSPDGVLVGKIAKFNDATFAIVDLLRRERRRGFKLLAEEAVAIWPPSGDPIDLKDQLRGSLDGAPANPKKRKPWVRLWISASSIDGRSRPVHQVKILNTKVAHTSIYTKV